MFDTFISKTSWGDGGLTEKETEDAVARGTYRGINKDRLDRERIERVRVRDREDFVHRLALEVYLKTSSFYPQWGIIGSDFDGWMAQGGHDEYDLLDAYMLMERRFPKDDDGRFFLDRCGVQEVFPSVFRRHQIACMQRHQPSPQYSEFVGDVKPEDSEAFLQLAFYR